MNLKLNAFPFLLLLLLLAAPVPVVAQGEKPKFKLGLILDDEKSRKSDKEKQIDAQVFNAATDAFVASRRFEMVERKQLAAVFTEKSLQDFIGGKVNNKLTDIRDLDLIGVVAHKVETTKTPQGKATTKWIIEARLIDVKTAALVVSLSSDHASRLSLLPPASAGEARPLLTQSIREAFPPMGYIIQINGKDIVVDLGSEVGLKKGDTLEVVQEGEQIIHPKTGQIMAAPLKIIGELKVQSATPQLAICKKASRKGAFKLEGLVRLKGTESVIVKWLTKVPRIIEEYKKKKEEIKVEE
jgi:hypothetical protein